MEITELQIDRWLERGSRFFKTVARNPVVRGTLLARGLTDEELGHGWKLYTELHGFGLPSEAHSNTKLTVAAQAINEIDAWDAPTFSAAHAVLDARYPEVARYLFDSLEAAMGIAAVVGVEKFLDRIDQLREGKVDGINADTARAAVELLAKRKVVEPERITELRALIQTAKLGARPKKVIAAPEEDPRRSEVARAFIQWLHEWREVSRVAIARRDYRISLGLAQRRESSEDVNDVETTTTAAVTKPVTSAPTTVAAKPVTLAQA